MCFSNGTSEVCKTFGLFFGCCGLGKNRTLETLLEASSKDLPKKTLLELAV